MPKKEEILKCDSCNIPIPEGHQYIETSKQGKDVKKYHLLCYNHIVQEKEKMKVSKKTETFL